MQLCMESVTAEEMYRMMGPMYSLHAGNVSCPLLVEFMLSEEAEFPLVRQSGPLEGTELVQLKL